MTIFRLYYGTTARGGKSCQRVLGMEGTDVTDAAVFHDAYNIEICTLEILQSAVQRLKKLKLKFLFSEHCGKKPSILFMI